MDRVESTVRTGPLGAVIVAKGAGIRFMTIQPYSPVQQGGRFSRKAEIPSWASAAREFMVMTSLA